MKILTVYFSKTGHTKAIAEMIHKAVGGELGEIRTKRSYAPSYGMAVLQGGLEQLRKSFPNWQKCLKRQSTMSYLLDLPYGGLRLRLL